MMWKELLVKGKGVDFCIYVAISVSIYRSTTFCILYANIALNFIINMKLQFRISFAFHFIYPSVKPALNEILLKISLPVIFNSFYISLAA